VWHIFCVGLPFWLLLHIFCCTKIIHLWKIVTMVGPWPQAKLINKPNVKCAQWPRITGVKVWAGARATTPWHPDQNQNQDEDVSEEEDYLPGPRRPQLSTACLPQMWPKRGYTDIHKMRRNFLTSASRPRMALFSTWLFTDPGDSHSLWVPFEGVGSVIVICRVTVGCYLASKLFAY